VLLVLLARPAAGGAPAAQHSTAHTHSASYVCIDLLPSNCIEPSSCRTAWQAHMPGLQQCCCCVKVVCNWASRRRLLQGIQQPWPGSLTLLTDHHISCRAQQHDVCHAIPHIIIDCIKSR
jgi:hypothetical protein